MKNIIRVLFIIFVFDINADIVVLNEIVPETGLNKIIEGDAKRKKDKLSIELPDGEFVVVNKEDVLKKFRNRKSYERYLEKTAADSDTDELIALEKEVYALREKLKSITDDKSITIRMVKNNNFEFYQFEQRLDSKRDMVKALSDNRIAVREYEAYHRKYTAFNTMRNSGAIVSVVTGLACAVMGFTAIGINVAPDFKEKYSIETSNRSLIIATGIAGGLCLTGAGIAIGGSLGSNRMKMNFVIPVEYYNNWLKKENGKIGSADCDSLLKLEFVCSF